MLGYSQKIELVEAMLHNSTSWTTATARLFLVGRNQKVWEIISVSKLPSPKIIRYDLYVLSFKVTEVGKPKVFTTIELRTTKESLIEKLYLLHEIKENYPEVLV